MFSSLSALVVVVVRRTRRRRMRHRAMNESCHDSLPRGRPPWTSSSHVRWLSVGSSMRTRECGGLVKGPDSSSISRTFKRCGRCARAFVVVATREDESAHAVAGPCERRGRVRSGRGRRGRTGRTGRRRRARRDGGLGRGRARGRRREEGDASREGRCGERARSARDRCEED